jgi:hypothetical protein
MKIAPLPIRSISCRIGTPTWPRPRLGGPAVAAGADLLVFPEYGRMELATLDGPEAAGDLERSLHAVPAGRSRPTS